MLSSVLDSKMQLIVLERCSGYYIPWKLRCIVELSFSHAIKTNLKSARLGDIQIIMAKISYYTEEGLQKLKNELRTLKTKERAKVAEQLAEARSQGDLSENAEYDAAKDAQGLLEMKISKLEQTLSNARIISRNDIDISQVSVLTKVKIKNLQRGQVFAYTLVAEEEADLTVGKISIESPIGKGLLGKRVGEVATIEVPAGKLEFKILAIEL